MKTNNLPTNRKNQKRGKQETRSSRSLRIFSIVMLLLLALTSFGRITSTNRRSSRSGLTPAGQGSLASSGTAARVLVFHREDGGSSLCEDLLISSVGDAIYSRCGNGVEKQYALNETERQQLQTWILEFRAVNYDHNDMSRIDGGKTQLYLNGQGTQRATDAETQQMIDFITALDKKIASQS